MVGMRTQFTSEQAPCGRTVDGEHYRDEDDRAWSSTTSTTRAAAATIRHEYHDGSIHTKAVRHDGKVVSDDFGPEHGA